jgi:hypothetical protein
MISTMSITEKQAHALLADVEVVPALEVGLLEAKRLREACLAEDIPAVIGSDQHCKKGCSPKAMLLVREADVPRLADLLRRGWMDELRRSGTLDLAGPAQPVDPDGEPPCPACGHAAELVEGACASCGLQLG